MEIDNVCKTCLRNSVSLTKVNLMCVGNNYDLLVCFLCLRTVSKIYAFQKQCTRAAQLLEEYKTNAAKSWLSYCSEKNIGGDGLQGLGVSETLCLDVEGDWEGWGDSSHHVECCGEGGLKVEGEVLVKDEMTYHGDEDLLAELTKDEFQVTNEEEQVDFYELNPVKVEKKGKKRKKKKRKGEEEVSGEEMLMCENDISDGEQMADMERRRLDPEYLGAEFKCELCYFGFQFQHSLDSHMKKHDMEAGELECWLCHQRFPSKPPLATHRRAYHSQRMWCGACGKRFYNKTRLKDHIETHKGKYHKCHICMKTFQSKGSLTRHVSSHQESDDLKCQYCGRVLKSKESLKSHTLIHENSRPHQCPSCPLAFPLRRHLHSHILRKHRPPKHHHYCVECDFSFKTHTDYKTHLTTKKHTDPTLLKFSCSKCSRRYTTEGELSRHVSAMHDRVLQYSCVVCPARYATKQGLNFHRRKAHEGFVQDKKYPCTYCHKAFISRALLESHVRIHTGEQPFQCRECGRTFSQPSSLRTHHKLKHLKHNTSNQ